MSCFTGGGAAILSCGALNQRFGSQQTRPVTSNVRAQFQSDRGSMDEQEIAQLELFCKQLYESPDPSIRSAAEKALILFAGSPDCLSKCQFLLERGSSSYSQLLAASTLSKLVVGASGSLSLQSKLDIRNYVLAYLMNRLKLAPFVVQALIQLLAKLTKFGWFDSQNDQFPFRDITDNVSKFLQGSMEHCVIGIKTLAELVSHMNQCEGSLSLSKNRKISSSFRDVSLHSIFTMSLDMLRQVSSKQVDFQDQMQLSLMRNLLQLVKNCLAFDFIGTSFDEATDDMGTVHVPTTWKQLFLDFSILHLFLDLYFAVPSSLSPLALANYVQLASVRRSLFDTNERAKYLQELANGVKRILEAPQLLEDHENYHEFCRLLARLKANYQLGEIIKVDGYREMMESVTKFTVTSLRMLHFAPNSVYYLLNLWQKMVASCPFIKASDPHLLERFTPQVTEAYISSRLESVTEVIRDGIEDPLNDRATLHQQLDQISTIARCEYPKTCNYLLSLFERAAQSYQELLSTASPSSQDVALQEGRLAWLVYIIGYCVGGRISFSSTDEHDSLDGELCCRILQLMNLTDLKLPQGGSEKLELALLAFLEQFRKIYVGDQINKSSKVYQVMSERVGIPDETTVLSVFVGKIITNMKYWARSDAVTDATLNLLNDLSVGFSSVRKLVKLDAVQFLLKNHTPDHFPFLGSQGNSILKCRTLFYTALGRLLLADLGDEDDRFDAFIMPITATLETLSNLLSNGNANSVQVDEAKHLTIGICRDLRGLAFAFTTKTSFLSFFSWLYPQYTSTILRSLELWYHDPSVTTPILTLFTEMTQNRSQRLMFDVMSPNGVLLFREISKVLVAYGSRILSMNAIPADKLYALKYKGVSLCFNMLKASLSGGYVNFGVLRLYGDDAIDNALRIFVKILLSIPHSDLLEFPKLSTSYYNLIEIISQDHIDQVCNMDAQIFLYILSSVSEGLSALDLAISTCCCATLDHIVTYLFQELHKVAKVNNPQKQNEHPALKVMEMRPEILQQMLSTVLNVVMFEECRNLWSMSRPLLGLILLNEKFFTELERTITEMQPIDKQAGMTQCLTDLMDNVERSLATKNRDRFTQNLSSFRNAVKNLIGSAPSSQSSIPVVEMMGYDM